MIKSINLILILSIKLILCIKITDFCYRISIKNEIKKCEECDKYHYDCGQGLSE